MNTKLEELEKLVKDKNKGEMKMELAVKKLENVMKVMTRKVISLEEELVRVKDILKNSSQIKKDLIIKKLVKKM